MALHRLISAICAATLFVLAPKLSAEGETHTGVPLGGIGCGSFQVLPNGRFAHATINNNWERPIDSMRGCFAAVWARAGEKNVSQVLSTSPEYSLPGSAAIEFDGYFPRANLKIADTRLPVTVTLRAYSPLVPQDLKNSSIPVAIVVVTLKNEAHAPVEASVAVSWENMLGVGGTASRGAFADRTGNRQEDLPVTGGIFGLRMASPEKQIVDPEHRLIYNARGTYALLAAPTTPDSVVTTAGWNALDATPGWWERFSRDGTVQGTAAAGMEGKDHPAGVIAVKVSLKENESQELPFAIAWHTPRLYALGGSEYGHFYEKSFGDAVEVGRYALENRQSLLALLDEWQNRLLRSTLPGDFSRRVMNDAGVLFTNTVLTRDGGLGGAMPGHYRFALLDSAGSATARVGVLDRRFRPHALLLSWFPDLDLLELSEIMSRQSPLGALPQAVGDLETGFSPEESPASVSGPATAASYVFQIAHRFRWTGDQKFLDRFYPSAKHAMEYLASPGADGGAGGVPGDVTGKTAKRHNRVDWLAACAMARDLAEAMHDKVFARSCANWIDKAERTPADAIPDERLSIEAAPAVWMADALEVSTPTITALAARLATSAGSSSSGAFPGVPAWLLDAANPDERGQLPSLGDAASWYAMRSAEGLRLDIPNGRLTLAPILPPKSRALSAPIYAPTFWASLDYRVSLTSVRLTFRLDRMMPALPARKQSKPVPGSAAGGAESPPPALVLNDVVLPERPDRVTTEMTASVGRAPIPGKFTRGSDGRLTFTFTTPLSLTVGQSLGFHMR